MMTYLASNKMFAISGEGHRGDGFFGNIEDMTLLVLLRTIQDNYTAEMDLNNIVNSYWKDVINKQ